MNETENDTGESKMIAMPDIERKDIATIHILDYQVIVSKWSMSRIEGYDIEIIRESTDTEAGQ